MGTNDKRRLALTGWTLIYWLAHGMERLAAWIAQGSGKLAVTAAAKRVALKEANP